MIIQVYFILKNITISCTSLLAPLIFTLIPITTINDFLNICLNLVS